MKQGNLVSKNDIASFVNQTEFEGKIKDDTSNKNELNKLSKNVKVISKKGLTTDLIDKFSILIGAKMFSSGIFQKYLVFILAKKQIKYFADTTSIELWKSNGL